MRARTINFSVEKDLPKRLTELRKAEGLTQVQIAQKLGITQSSYAHYESGFRKISLAMIPKIAQTLGISEEELLGLEPQKGKRGPSSALERRVEAIQALPKKEQRYIIETIDRLLKTAS
jgi:transcriptional regulator with XRE-family HTH domain